MKVVINAGTKVTGFSNNFNNLLADENVKPPLELIVRAVQSQGFTDIIMTVNQLKYQVMEYFGDGTPFGVKIDYFNDFMPLGTAGVLFQLKAKLNGEDFIYINNEDAFNIDYNRLVEFHQARGCMATILANPGRRAADVGNHIITDMESRVKKWPPEDDKRPTRSKKLTSAGVYVISQELFKSANFSLRSKVDLDKDMLLPLAGTKPIYCCETREVLLRSDSDDAGANDSGYEKIVVNTTEPYDIVIGNGLVNRLSELIEPYCPTSRVALITGVNSGKLYAEAAENSLKKAGYDVCTYSEIHGEESKSFAMLENVLDFLADNDIRRIDLIVALGGGVTCDVAGLAAALYMRGMNYVNVPTTLLSAIDTSIGGKTGVESKTGRNLAGAFHQPSMVIIDTDIINGLPKDIYKQGVAEIMKYALVSPINAMDFIVAGTLKDHLYEVMLDCIKVKKNAVERDEFDDNGIRDLLNAGHIAANALIKISEGAIPYEVAEAMGLYYEAKIAERLRICARDVPTRLLEVAKAAGLYVKIPYTEDEILEAMHAVSANGRGKAPDKLKLCLPRKIGSCGLFDV